MYPYGLSVEFILVTSLRAGFITPVTTANTVKTVTENSDQEIWPTIVILHQTLENNKKLAKYLWEIQSYAFYIGILLNVLTLIFLAFLFVGSRSLATWRCEVLPPYNQGNQGRRLQRWCEKNCVEALPYQR